MAKLTKEQEFQQWLKDYRAGKAGGFFLSDPENSDDSLRRDWEWDRRDRARRNRKPRPFRPRASKYPLPDPDFLKPRIESEDK